MVDRIIPKYRSDNINVPIDLGSRNVEIFSNGKSINGHGVAQFQMGQRERVIITVEVEAYFDSMMIRFSKADLFLKLEGSKKPTAVICTETRTTNDKCELQLLARSGFFELCRDRRVRLASAILHLLNFPAFICLCANSPDFNFENGRSLRRLGRVVLKHDGWRIEIQELPETQEIIKQLKTDGGGGITHVLKVVREDGRSFSVSALWKVIHDLHRFLSFARGQWTSILVQLDTTPMMPLFMNLGAIYFLPRGNPVTHGSTFITVSALPTLIQASSTCCTTCNCVTRFLLLFTGIFAATGAETVRELTAA